MNPIAFILGEPNSVSSELLFKTWLKRKALKIKPFLVIGSVQLLIKQAQYLNYKIKFNKINSKFISSKLSKNKINIINVNFNQKKAFKNITNKSNSLIFKSVKIAVDLIKKNKVTSIINGPIAKETLLKNKFNGMTEYLSLKTNSKGKEVMLIYNEKLSVSPITTHIPVRFISKNINSKKIYNKIEVIINFYKKFFSKKIKIGVTGLNPHCYGKIKKNEENTIIKPAINKLKRKYKNIKGPLSADSLFINENIKKYDVIIGMYHDQVLGPMKTIFGQNAINITLGLPFFRVSPDHGVCSDIVGKNLANPSSLIKCFKFLKIVK
tara:strand:+ start:287 stop:1255 length:969 start_codon:yes stop_codon:yes gene_type:complete